MRWGLRRWPVAVAAVAGVSALVVAGTGFWLSESYRPRWVGERPGPGGVDVGHGWVHEAHVWSAMALQGAVVVLVLILLTAVRRSSRRHLPGTPSQPLVAGMATLGLVLVTTVALGFVSGRDLGWTQIGLWAVTTGQDLGSIWDLAFDDTVRFVWVPGHPEMSPDEYRKRVVAHFVAVPVLAMTAAAATGVIARRAWRASDEEVTRDTSRRKPVGT